MSFWQRSGSLEVRSREAFGVTALAYINTRWGHDASLLMRPYPSTMQPRIPALYLDGFFLEQCKPNVEVLLQCLSPGTSDIPPQLLRQLLSSLLAESKQDTSAPVQLTMRIAKLLTLSERPEIASDIVKHFVLDRPEDSAWHRHRHGQSYLNRLSKTHAESLLLDMATSMRRLIETSRDSKPLVKVTTQRALAKLLGAGNLVDPTTSCEILAKLSTIAHHPNVIFAIIKSLCVFRHHPRATHTIRELVVPLGGMVGTRGPRTLDDWEAYDNGINEHMDLPDPDNDYILETLLECRPMAGQAQHSWIQDIVLPVLELSMSHHRRWLSLFLSRNKFENVTIADMPESPLIPDYVLRLFQLHPQLYGTFKIIQSYIAFQLSPPGWAIAVCDTIRSNEELVYSRAGEHWLSLFPRSDDGLPRGMSHFVLALACKELHDSAGPVTGATMQLVKNSILDMSRQLIDDSHVKMHDLLVQELIDMWTSDDDISWTAHACPLLQQLLACIDGLRTEEWLRDHLRNPRRLLDTHAHRLSMLGRL